MRTVLLVSCLFFLAIYSESTNASNDTAVGRITFAKGEVKTGQEGDLKPVITGQPLTLNSIIVTGPEAKAKFLLEQSNTLVTILAETKVMIAVDGVKLLAGSENNISKKHLEVLKPDPELTEKSRHLGGSFAMRHSTKFNLVTLNLDDTFIRETMPVFRWKCSQEGSFVLSLFEAADDGGKKMLWERQTSGTSLPFPENEPALEHGKSYYWEIFELTTGQSSVISSHFYLLSEKELKAFEDELKELNVSIEAEEEDQLTAGYLKVELLHKYYLKDEAERLREQLLSADEE